MAAAFGGGRDAFVVVVGSKVLEPGVGVGEEVPDDGQDLSADRDHGLLLAPSAGEAAVAGAGEGVGSAGHDRGFAERTSQVAVAVSGGAVALVFPGAGLDPG